MLAVIAATIGAFAAGAVIALAFAAPGSATPLRSAAVAGAAPPSRTEQEGGTISATCETCHRVRAQGTRTDGWAYAAAERAFVHPPDGEIMDTPTLCHECHDGSLGW